MINYHNFRIGSFQCTNLLDGYMNYPVRNIYANVPLEQVEAALLARGLPADHVTTPYTYPYVDTGDHRVLVDIGAGSLVETTGRLMDSVHAAGIDPAEVDTVVISHAHPDHVGGMLDANGQLNFPNAHYFISKDEWDFWFSAEAPAKVAELFIQVARRNLEPIRERVTLTEGDCEVRPGVRLIPAPGHTPGHSMVRFTSSGETLAYIADTVIQPLHLEQPEWLSIYDIIPEKAAQSKRQVFDRASAENWLVLGQHFPPFPGLGSVRKLEAGWKWTPS